MIDNSFTLASSSSSSKNALNIIGEKILSKIKEFMKNFSQIITPSPVILFLVKMDVVHTTYLLFSLSHTQTHTHKHTHKHTHTHTHSNVM